MQNDRKDNLKSTNLIGKLSIAEAMKRAGIGEHLFWKLVGEGKIRIRQLSPKKRFVFTDEFDEDMRNMPIVNA